MNLFPDFLSASLVLISIFSWLFSVSRLSFSFLPQFLPFSLSLARSLFQVGPLRAVSAASDMFSFHSGNFSSPWWVSRALHEAAPSSQWLTQDALFGNGRSIFLVKYNSTEDSAQSWCYCWSVGRGCSSSGFPGWGGQKEVGVTSLACQKRCQPLGEMRVCCHLVPLIQQWAVVYETQREGRKEKQMVMGAKKCNMGDTE